MDPKHDAKRLLELLDELSRDSELLAELEPKAEAHFISLSDELVCELEGQGNRCADWDRISVHPDFDPSLVSGCVFSGNVYLGLQDATFESSDDGETCSTAIRNCSLSNCHIQGNCILSDVGLLEGYYLDEGVIVSGVGRMTFERGASFGNGTTLSLGLESGERNIRGFAEMSLEMAAALAHGEVRKGLLEDFERFVDFYVSAASSAHHGRICSKARVISTPMIIEPLLCW